MQKIDHLQSKMRTRKLTCPLSNHRMKLQTEYFEKSVKKSLPKWLNQLQKWNDNNLHRQAHPTDDNYSSKNDNQSIITKTQNDKHTKMGMKMDRLFVPHA